MSDKSQKREQQMIEMQTRFDVNKLELEKSKLANKNKQIALTGTFILLLAAIGWSIYQRTMVKRLKKMHCALMTAHEEVRKQSMKATESEKMKTAFLNSICHEIRTPLNAIVGFSGLIATASDEEEKKLYMDIISENNERLLRLINDIFDLSQIEAGTLNFEYSEFDANDLLRELEGMFKVKLFNNPSVDLICEDSVQSIIMYSERQRIIQVMANLIHNAIKFTKSGEIRFSCRMEGTDEVYFYVSDTGIGIPKEEQQEIFSSFKKLDREVPGTGLGLTLSQTIIQNLGGRAGLESEVNKGSTFWFVVPLIMDPYN